MGSGTGFSDDKIYVIYIDRLGTSSFIREKDSTYDNRIGFYEMSPLYQESYDVFRSVFGTDFKFFGFSDTIVAAPQTRDASEVAKAASMVFESLLDYSIATRVYITHGDFAFHRFEDLSEETENFVCPIYGNTILDAHEMNEWGVKCLGVFVHPSILDTFALAKSAIFSDGSLAGLLDLPTYLPSETVTALIGTLSELGKIQDEDKATSRVAKIDVVQTMTESMKKHGISQQDINDSLKKSVMRSNRNKRAILAYCTALVDAMSGGRVVVGRHEN